MKNFTGKITDHLNVRDTVEITGALENGATVYEGGALYVQGAVAGDLIVEAGAQCVITGACTADVDLRGTLIVTGVFMSDLHHYEGTLAVSIGTVVGNGILQADGSLMPLKTNNNNNLRIDVSVENMRYLTQDGVFVTIDELREMNS